MPIVYPSIHSSVCLSILYQSSMYLICHLFIYLPSAYYLSCIDHHIFLTYFPVDGHIGHSGWFPTLAAMTGFSSLYEALPHLFCVGHRNCFGFFLCCFSSAIRNVCGTKHKYYREINHQNKVRKAFYKKNQ